jgi:hypothetical protein
MKPEELRIGNIVAEFGIPIIVTGSLIARLEEITNKGKIAIDLSPIPITDEWLLEKCGFKEKKDFAGKYFELNADRVYLWDNGIEYERTVAPGIRVNLFKKYQYIHQLQNLYYALTGEELTVNL